MSTVTMTTSAIRDLVNEALDNKSMAKSVMSPFALTNQVNPVVSPAAPYDSPMNPDFIPQDKPEFVVAMQRAVQGFDDTDIPKLYKSIVDALEEFGIDPETRIPNEKKKDEEEKRKAALGGKKDDRSMKKTKDTKEESIVRAAVKRILNEVRHSPPQKNFGKLPEEEDDPVPYDAGSAEFDAWEERQGERERQSDYKRRGTHEKNYIGEIPATDMSRRFAMTHSTYAAGEQQLLSKFLSILLDPTSTKSQREAQKSKYVRDSFKRYMDILAEIFAEDDPNAEDPGTQQFMRLRSNQEYQSEIYENSFQAWYQENLAYQVSRISKELSVDLRAAVSEDEKDEIREELEDLREAQKELSKLPTSLGAGYTRIDQDPAGYSRLHNLYQSSWGDNEPSRSESIPSRSGGRKAQADRAVKTKSKTSL